MSSTKKEKTQKPGARIFFAVGLIVVAALAWLFLRPGKDPAGRLRKLWAGEGVAKPNVILVTLDTTRADHLGCYGYPLVRTPNLDALAARGVLFEQAATATPLTLPAHSTIMTGMLPTYHGVRVNGNTALSEEQTTLAEVLRGRGYQTGAFIAAFVLDGRWGLKQGFDHYDDQFDLKKYKHLDLGGVQRPGNVVMDATLAWLEEKKTAPFFAWVHLYDPHSPYAPPEPYATEYGGRGLAGLYDGEIAFMDEQVGRLASWLEQNGLDKKTVLVLAGDHGEGLGNHGEATHGFFIYDSALHVPLIVVTPFAEMRGVRVSAQSQLADIFPTVLDLVGSPSPISVQGRSLLPLAFRPDLGREAPAYGESLAPNVQFGWSPLHSLRTPRYKFIDAPRPELYDLVQDPSEQLNIVRDRPEMARKMKTELDRLMAETSRGAPTPQAANLDKETVERLAALGYIGAPVAARKAAAEPKALADPKDKVQIFEAVLRAGELIMGEDYPSAAAALEAALREEPGIPQALLLLATCYKELGRKEEAKANLDLLLRDNPENTQALISLAGILKEEGKSEDVLALCKRTLSVDEKNVQAFILIGEVHVARKDSLQALPYFEKAVEIQPKLTQNRLSLAACLIDLKQYDRAEPLLKEIIEKNPKFPFAHFNLGLLYEEQGRWAEAKAAYAEAVSLFPKDFRSRFNFGKVLFRLGDRAGYLNEMREVIQIAPGRAEGYLFLARGLLLEPNPLGDVQAVIEKGLGLAKTSELKALGYFLLADIYNRRHEPEKMRDALQRAESYRSRKDEP